MGAEHNAPERIKSKFLKITKRDRILLAFAATIAMGGGLYIYGEHRREEKIRQGATDFDFFRIKRKELKQELGAFRRKMEQLNDSQSGGRADKSLERILQEFDKMESRIGILYLDMMFYALESSDEK